jgi:hypothetical protein
LFGFLLLSRAQFFGGVGESELHQSCPLCGPLWRNFFIFSFWLD